MRLPQNQQGTDIEQVKKMVDLFMESGFTYFDTAFVYGTSKEDTRKALVERYPRESYTLATKINAFMMAPDENAAKNQFIQVLNEQVQAILIIICSMLLWKITTQNMTNLISGIS